MSTVAAMADIGDKLDMASERLERAVKTLSGFNTGNQSTIHINAGGIGVWLACSMCAVMLACNVFLAVLYIDQQRQIASLNEYLAAIYMIAPDLKPKEEDHGNRRQDPAPTETAPAPGAQ